jgi:hypothetical protein
MADDKKKIGKADRDKVAGGERYEIEYLARKLGVKPADVIKAIEKVGNSREKIEKELTKK